MDQYRLLKYDVLGVPIEIPNLLNKTPVPLNFPVSHHRSSEGDSESGSVPKLTAWQNAKRAHN